MQEIERKFLVIGDAWRTQTGPGILYHQGYLQRSRLCTVRVRVAGSQAYLTIKGDTQNITRSEFEYPIPRDDAEIILQTLCTQPIIEKIRYKLTCQGWIWEIDEFLGANYGLILAEIELPCEDQVFPKPDWLGPEVSHDYRYFNSQLLDKPYRFW